VFFQLKKGPDTLIYLFPLPQHKGSKLGRLVGVIATMGVSSQTTPLYCPSCSRHFRTALSSLSLLAPSQSPHPRLFFLQSFHLFSIGCRFCLCGGVKLFVVGVCTVCFSCFGCFVRWLEEFALLSGVLFS